MGEDMQVGGGYVRIGAKTDALEEMLGKSESLTKNTLASMGSMADSFARSFSNAMGLALPAVGVAGLAGTVPPGLESLKGLEQLQIVSKQLGVNFGDATKTTEQMYDRFSKVVEMTKQESAEIMALGLRTGLINKDLSNAGDYFDRIRALSQMSFSRKTPAQVAEDISGQMISGAFSGGDYGVFGDYGMFPQMGFDALWKKADEARRRPDEMKDTNRQRMLRFKAQAKDLIRDIGIGAFEIGDFFWNQENAIEGMGGALWERTEAPSSRTEQMMRSMVMPWRERGQLSDKSSLDIDIPTDLQFDPDTLRSNDRRSLDIDVPFNRSHIGADKAASSGTLDVGQAMQDLTRAVHSLTLEYRRQSQEP